MGRARLPRHLYASRSQPTTEEARIEHTRRLNSVFATYPHHIPRLPRIYAVSTYSSLLAGAPCDFRRNYFNYTILRVLFESCKSRSNPASPVRILQVLFESCKSCSNPASPVRILRVLFEDFWTPANIQFLLQFNSCFMLHNYIIMVMMPVTITCLVWFMESF
jgi:hypothetical protein